MHKQVDTDLLPVPFSLALLAVPCGEATDPVGLRVDDRESVRENDHVAMVHVHPPVLWGGFELPPKLGWGARVACRCPGHAVRLQAVDSPLFSHVSLDHGLHLQLMRPDLQNHVMMSQGHDSGTYHAQVCMMLRNNLCRHHKSGRRVLQLVNFGLQERELVLQDRRERSRHQILDLLRLRLR